METRANHFVVGTIALALLAFVFGFVHWMTNRDLDSSAASYRILFAGSVAGLAPASNVLFNGIRVGRVQSVGIYAADSRKAEVIVRLKAGTPIRIGSIASITQAGITGLSSIQVSPGQPDQPFLKVGADGEGPPLIQTNPAMAGSLMDAMPEVLANVNALFVRLNEMVASNEGKLGDAIDNFHAFTSVLKANTAEMDGTIKNVSRISSSFQMASAKLEQMMTTLDADVVGGDQSLIRQAKDAMAALKHIATSLDKTVGDNAIQVTTVAKRSLEEMERLASDTRRVAQSLDRILVRVERDPKSLIWGSTTVRQYKPE